MDVFWQVVLGTGIGGLLITIYKLYKDYIRESKKHNEKQGLAKASIIFGTSGIFLVFIGSLIGIILGILSMRGKKFKVLSRIGILVSILTMLPWLLVLILGE